MTKRLLPILILASGGCTARVTILDARVEREPSGEIRIRFRTDQDIRSLATFVSAHLYVREPGVDALREAGHCILWGGRVEDDGPPRAYRCRFPSHGKPGGLSDVEVKAAFDLRNGGPVDFWIGGAHAHPGGFESNRIPLAVPAR